MTTLLVTGGAGFIGSNFVRHIYHKYPDYKIIVLDALTYAGSVENLPAKSFSDRLEFWYGSVLSADLVESLVKRSDQVIHFAAETHVTRSIFDNRSFFETDVMGTQIVANAVLHHRQRVKRFIHISTSEVYGTALTEKMAEDHPLYPASPYAAAKCGADRLVYSYWNTYQLPAIIVRPFNNFGPYQHLEKLIPRFITSCLLDEPLTIHGDGLAARDFIHVSDTVACLDQLLHAPDQQVIGEVFNLGSGEHISTLDIARAISQLTQRPEPQLSFISDRPGQVRRHTCDYRKLQQTLGWQPKVKFLDGLKETITWYQNNRTWWTPQLWLRHIPIVTADGKRDLH